MADEVLVRFVLAFDLLLALSDACMPTLGIFPLLGSHLSQLGLLFGLGFLGKECAALMKKRRR